MNTVTAEKTPSVCTSYGLRRPEKDEILATFGDFDSALRITGGDIPALCYCIANPHLIPRDGKPANVYDDGMAPQLREWIKEDREAAMCATWRAMAKPSVAEVMRQHGCSFDYAARVLAAAGLRT